MTLHKDLFLYYLVVRISEHTDVIIVHLPCCCDRSLESTFWLVENKSNSNSSVTYPNLIIENKLTLFLFFNKVNILGRTVISKQM